MESPRHARGSRSRHKVSAEQFSDRFEREARAIAALNHPAICTLFDLGRDYLVMELIDGPTLAERIKEAPIPLEEALATARQIADGLDAAHEKNIVHRDLEPGNTSPRKSRPKLGISTASVRGRLRVRRAARLCARTLGA